jgi:hypothetical protein
MIGEDVDVLGKRRLGALEEGDDRTTDVELGVGEARARGGAGPVDEKAEKGGTSAEFWKKQHALGLAVRQQLARSSSRSGRGLAARVDEEDER